MYVVMGISVSALWCLSGCGLQRSSLAYYFTSPQSTATFRERTQTGQSVDAIDIHSAAPTNTLPTAPSKSERRVNFILNPDQRIQHHRTGLIQVQRVRLHLRLAGRLIGVPSVDVEGLDFGI